ncbi:MAG: GNAT family N-acetyltransferase [Hyphomicrobiales bacterium]
MNLEETAQIQRRELDLEPKAILAGHVRRIWPVDAGLYRAHLLRLDREGRGMRFAGAISDDCVADYSRSISDPSRVLHGFLQGRDLRGAAELVPLEDRERMAEAAFSVEQGYRRQGIGRELMARSIRAARTRGIKRLLVRCLPTNRAMQGLARQFSAEIIFESGDVLGLIDPPPATGATFADEAVDGMRSLALAWFELAPRYGRGSRR